MSIDFKVHTYASLSSTQDYVKELAAEGLPEGTVVQCLEQKGGRGRHGRIWESSIGNLYMSVLLRPGCPPAKAGQLSFVAAVALSSAMDDVLRPGLAKTLKWPNDILIDGRKVSGILIEKEGDAYVLGVGVNILSAPQGAAFLKELAAPDARLAIHPFRDLVLERLSHYYGLWRQEGFAQIRILWLSQAHGLGQGMVVRLPDGADVSAIFRSIDEAGVLQAEMQDGSYLAINAGEVFFPDV